MTIFSDLHNLIFHVNLLKVDTKNAYVYPPPKISQPPLKIIHLPPKTFQPPLKISQPHSKKFQSPKNVNR